MKRMRQLIVVVLLFTNLISCGFYCDVVDSGSRYCANRAWRSTETYKKENEEMIEK